MTASTHTPTSPWTKLIYHDLDKLNQALLAADEAKQHAARHLKAATVAMNDGDTAAAAEHFDQSEAASRRALEAAAVARTMHAHAGDLLNNL